MNRMDLKTKLKARDFHCWIKLQDGSIYDPTKIMNESFIKTLHNISDDEKMVYEEFSDSDRLFAWKHIYNNHIKLMMKVMSEEDAITTFLNSPCPNLCWMNCYAYYLKHKGKCRYCIGKAGWTQKNGEVWWGVWIGNLKRKVKIYIKF